MEPSETVSILILFPIFLLFYGCIQYLLDTANEYQESLKPHEEEPPEEPEPPPSNEEIEAELLASGELSENEQLLALLDPEEPPAETENSAASQGSLENLKSLYQAGVLSREEYKERRTRIKEKENA